MAVLAPHRFTVAEYHRMAETGILAPDARVELLEGEIIDKEPIGPFHGGVIKRLNHLFTPKAGGRWVTSIQDPLYLDEHSQPEPDLMLLRPAEGSYADASRSLNYLPSAGTNWLEFHAQRLTAAIPARLIVAMI